MKIATGIKGYIRICKKGLLGVIDIIPANTRYDCISFVELVDVGKAGIQIQIVSLIKLKLLSGGSWRIVEIAIELIIERQMIVVYTAGNEV